MKRFNFKIGAWQAGEIFSPVRSKTEIINLLMKTIKIMITNQEIDEKHIVGHIILVVSKMSRLFYFTENKYFSINFPFTVTETKDGLIYSSGHVSDIDSRITSQVISILCDGDSFDSDCIYTFSDRIAEIVDYNNNFWAFLKHLLLYDDGYIRYEHDTQHENGHLHPLNHYDVFFSSNSTFKIGLKERIDPETIIDFLSIDSNCHFLEKRL